MPSVDAEASIEARRARSAGTLGSPMDLLSADVTVSGIPISAHGLGDDAYFSSVASSGSVFEPAAALLRRLDDSSATFLDVGASIGLVSAAAVQILPDGIVVSIEPEPRALRCLRRTLAHAPNASIVPAAVGREVATASFHQDPGGTAWGMISDREPSIDVPLITIDSLVEERHLDRLDVIKVDVEGFELDVLVGASASLARFEPLLVVELNPYCLWRHGRCLPQDLVDAVLDLAPRVVAIGADGVATDMTKPELRDGMLHHLSTTGSVADLVAIPEGRCVSTDLRDIASAAQAPASAVTPESVQEPGDPTSLDARPEVPGRIRRGTARLRAALERSPRR